MISKRKRFGQHFLKDKNIIKRILKIIDPQLDETILEIGAGKGALTIPLSHLCKTIIAVERDANLVEFLRNMKLRNVEIIETDILTLDLERIFKEEVKIVGNLPYSISSRILGWLIKNRDFVKRSVFMLQKEVAERIASQPGKKSYSSLSIHTQIFFEPKIHFCVPPRSFSPPPEVISSIIELKKREVPILKIDDEQSFVEFIRKSFMKRRKTLFNNLISMGLNRKKIYQVFQSTGIDLKKRPEEIGMETFFYLWKNLT